MTENQLMNPTLVLGLSETVIKLPTQENQIDFTGFVRNRQGLLPNVSYVHNPDGTVNWRKMIKPEFLVPNKKRTEEIDISKLEDKDLIILLAGLKELAATRGYESVSYKVVAASPQYFATTCKIVWLPNFETGGRPIEFEAIADACPETTGQITRLHLAAVAENRAFCRCVRNFLKIHIVSDEEVGNSEVRDDLSKDESSTADPKTNLENSLLEKGIDFNKFKEIMTTDGVKNVEKITTFKEVPKLKVFEYLDRVKKGEFDNCKAKI